MKIIYTDGSYKRSTKDGGWSYIKICKNKIYINYGYTYNKTSIYNELIAFYNAIKNTSLKKERIKIFVDSSYVVNSYNLYVDNWINNNWKNSDKKIISYIDIWIDLYNIKNKYKDKIIVEWIKAHNGDFFNTLCDSYANKASKLKIDKLEKYTRDEFKNSFKVMLKGSGVKI